MISCVMYLQPRIQRTCISAGKRWTTEGFRGWINVVGWFILRQHSQPGYSPLDSRKQVCQYSRGFFNIYVYSLISRKIFNFFPIYGFLNISAYSLISCGFLNISAYSLISRRFLNISAYSLISHRFLNISKYSLISRRFLNISGRQAVISYGEEEEEKTSVLKYSKYIAIHASLS